MKHKSFLLILLSMLFLSGCQSPVSDLRAKGIECIEKGHYKEAEDTLNEALSKSYGIVGKEQIDIMFYRFEAEFMMGDYEKASKTLDIISNVNGEESVSLLREELLGKQYVKKVTEYLNQDDTESAARFMEMAESKVINDRELEFDRIVYLEKTAKWREALEKAEDFLENYPDSDKAKREYEFLSNRVTELDNNEYINK